MAALRVEIVERLAIIREIRVAKLRQRAARDKRADLVLRRDRLRRHGGGHEQQRACRGQEAENRKTTAQWRPVEHAEMNPSPSLAQGRQHYCIDPERRGWIPPPAPSGVAEVADQTRQRPGRRCRGPTSNMAGAAFAWAKR